MKAAYYDASYLFKLQCQEHGSSEVRAHATEMDVLVCSLHGRIEFVSAAHRKVREGAATLSQLGALVTQLDADTSAGGIRWIPITEFQVRHIESVYRSASPTFYLRAADALHLASAAGQGLSKIFSSDRHLLSAAPLFGLQGVNVIR